MSCLVKNQNQNAVPMHHESGVHTSSLWCIHCKQPNHTAQFCPILLQQQPSQCMTVNTQPYRPPHQVGQATSNPPPGHRFQPHNCGTCGNKHPPGKCWIENQVVCSNCGGYHPTDRCKKPDKIIPLNPPPGDYQKQARDNMRGVRFPEPMTTNGPPNLFYDH